MIHNTTQVQELVSEAIGGEVYLSFPQRKIQRDMPFGVLSLISAPPIMSDRLNEDVASRVTYTLRIFSDSQRGLMSLVDSVSDLLGRYRITTLGMSPAYSDPTYGPFRILTLEVILDRRGNTFKG